MRLPDDDLLARVRSGKPDRVEFDASDARVVAIVRRRA